MGAKQDEFIKEVGTLARAEYLSRQKWVLPSVCIAQAALESGWNLDAKTLFGIKATGDDESFIANTKEYYNDNWEDVQAAFKAYPNIAAAVDGYYDLITGLDRYEAAVNNPDPIATAQAIARGGYATAPNYADTVISIIRGYNLTAWDTREEEKPQKKTNEEIAQEVIRGEWGNGEERRKKLTAAGYDYETIQGIVDEMLAGSTSERTYTVKKGDSLWKIAAMELGNGARFKEIRDLNGIKNNLIHPGQVLKLPRE